MFCLYLKLVFIKICNDLFRVFLNVDYFFIQCLSFVLILYVFYVGVDYLILILIYICRISFCCSCLKIIRMYWRVYYYYYDFNGCDVNGFSRGYGCVVYIGL